jgi:hypothetical protein
VTEWLGGEEKKKLPEWVPFGGQLGVRGEGTLPLDQDQGQDQDQDQAGR